MKTSDITEYKDKVKASIHRWADGKVDYLLPGNKEAARTFIKNAISNILSRYDEKIGGALDTFSLFVANENGEIDSDVVVEHLANMFNELEPIEYSVGGFKITASNGRAEIILPDNLIVKLIAGNIEGIALNADDIRELKTIINNN